MCDVVADLIRDADDIILENKRWETKGYLSPKALAFSIPRDATPTISASLTPFSACAKQDAIQPVEMIPHLTFFVAILHFSPLPPLQDKEWWPFSRSFFFLMFQGRRSRAYHATMQVHTNTISNSHREPGG